MPNLGNINAVYLVKNEFEIKIIFFSTSMS